MPTEIETKFAEINIERTPQLLLKIKDEQQGPNGGLFQTYIGGEAIYWHPNTGAHLIYGLIKWKYLLKGGPGSGLGYPTNDESDAGSGGGSRFNNFQNGTIIWKNGTNEAFIVRDAILSKWAENNWDSGYLGFPLSDEIETQGTNGNGIHQFFENGTIFWTPQKGVIIKHTIVNIQKPKPGLENQVAFVLSGGGSRGDFQLGALAALIESGINPDIIYSTSVGSLNGLMIAHGTTGLETLKNLWFGLRKNEHMYVYDDWWELLNPDIKNFLQSMVSGNPNAQNIFEGNIAKNGAIHFIIAGLVGLIDFANVTVQNLLDVGRLLQNNAFSAFNLNPIRDLFNIFVIPELVNAWVKSGDGKKLRMATVGLGSGELCYVTESGELLDRDQQNVLATGISLVNGAFASSSIGGVFVPPVFANDRWVDGGHRENIPLQGAIDAGARKIYVISSGPVNRYSSINFTEEGNVAENYTTGKHVLDIAVRAIVEISGDEGVTNDIFSIIDGFGADIKLISPQFPTHFIITIDAELIRINYNYGYRVALDVLNNVSGNFREMSDQIAIKQAKVSVLRQKTLKALGVPFSPEIASLNSEINNLIQLRQQNNLSISGIPASQPIGLGDTLLPGEMLVPGQCIVSGDPGHQYTLLFNTNGNLELYLRAGANLYGQAPVWTAPIPAPEPGGICIMQMDGNLVVYNNQMTALWSSATFKEEYYNGYLRIQSDGILSLNKENGGGVYWTSSGVINVPVKPQEYVTIQNNSPLNVAIRFYNVGDTSLNILFTLIDGLRTVPPNGMVSWPLPSGVNTVLVTFNGNPGSVKTISAGETQIYVNDERIHIINNTSGGGTIRIYDGNQLLGPGGIPYLNGGTFAIGGNQTIDWQMPDEALKVWVTFNDINPQQVFRSGKYEYSLEEPRVYIENLSLSIVKVQFFDEADTSAATSIFSRIGEDRDMNANEVMYYSLPNGAKIIQIRFVQSGKPNQLVSAGLGSKFSYNENGTVSIPILP